MENVFNPTITSELIEKFNPCHDRFDNWNREYPGFCGDALDFLSLDRITAKDKVWVCVRVLPRALVETFAIDCAFSAAAAAYAAAYAAYAASAAADAASAAADAAAYAASAAAYAAYAAAYAAASAAYAAASAADAAAYAAERERQVDALIYLITEFERDRE